MSLESAVLPKPPDAYDMGMKYLGDYKYLGAFIYLSKAIAQLSRVTLFEEVKALQ